MLKDQIYIVSWYGAGNAGGVERVTQYLMEIWSKQFEVQIIDFSTISTNKKYAKWLHKHYILDAIIVSDYVRTIQKNNQNAKIVIQGFNCPFVIADLAIAHGTMRGYKISVTGDKKWHFNQLYEKIGTNRAKKVMAVGQHVKQELSDLYGVDSNKILVIENCVDSDAFYPTPNCLDDGICKILFVGRLEERKGLNTVIDLAKKIENNFLFRLIIATNNKDNTDLFDNLKNTEIRVGLNKSQMNAFYNSGNVMFFPSLYEGFEMVTTECLSCGIPVIGNNIGAVGDLYAQGQEGVAILSDDMDKNLEMIADLYKTYNSMDAKNRLHQKIKKNYGMDAYMKKLQKVWEE